MMITIVAKIRATNLLAASENVAGCVEPSEQTEEELGEEERTPQQQRTAQHSVNESGLTLDFLEAVDWLGLGLRYCI